MAVSINGGALFAGWPDNQSPTIVGLCQGP